MKNNFVKGQFSWQSGFGAFSYSKSQIPQVIQYITSQEKHHKKTTFLEEYKDMLGKFGIDYNDWYILWKSNSFVPNGTKKRRKSCFYQYFVPNGTLFYRKYISISSCIKSNVTEFRNIKIWIVYIHPCC